MPRSVLLFDPYLPTLGGGERYLYSLAGFFAEDNADVVVAAPDLPAQEALLTLGFDTRVARERIAIRELQHVARGFDLIVYSTVESPPALRHPKAFLIVQFAFPLQGRTPAPVKQWRLRHSLRGYQGIVYSEFARFWLRERWSMESVVLPPEVSPGRYDPTVKRRLILAVGRFFPGHHSKRQDVLIDAFKALPPEISESWTLVLAGGAKDDEESRDYIESLRHAAAGHNISLQVNVSAQELHRLYTQAAIFWHATGFGRRASEPEKAEHFGMTTVEAMSYGCVPMAYNDGGQREILDGVGVLWDSPQHLIEATRRYASDLALRERTAQAVVARAARYSPTVFRERCRSVFGSATRRA